MPDSTPKELASWLQSNSRLTELDISWNKLKPVKYAPLIEQLSKNRTLTSVNLSWNGIFFDEVAGSEPNFEDKEWFLKEKMNDYNTKLL